MNTFDINAACDHFDCEDAKSWDQVNRVVVVDGQTTETVMTQDGFYDIAESEYQAFDLGVRYALEQMNRVLKNAGVAVEVQQCDLVDSLGYVLIQKGDTPKKWAKRVVK